MMLARRSFSEGGWPTYAKDSEVICLSSRSGEHQLLAATMQNPAYDVAGVIKHLTCSPSLRVGRRRIVARGGVVQKDPFHVIFPAVKKWRRASPKTCLARWYTRMLRRIFPPWDGAVRAGSADTRSESFPYRRSFSSVEIRFHQ